MNPNRDEVNAELARVLRSRAFARSQRARDLLLYLVSSLHDGGTTRLKESVIALDVFGRDAATYDSTNDGIVRVSVNRLRELLDRYYGDEGRSNGLRIEIQRGGYVPIVRRNTPAGLPAKPRIAVLPLANFTGRSDEDALCDGLSEDIIDAMTRLPDVRVIARTSSFRYKNANRDVREIATELAVDALLEGSVQLDGAQLKVTTQLVLGSDGSHLWSHVFTFARDERHVLLDALIDLMLRSLTLGAVADAPHVVARNTAPQVQGLIDQARGLNVTQTPENLALAEAMATREQNLIRSMPMPGLYLRWCATRAVPCCRVSQPSIRAMPRPRSNRPLPWIRAAHRRVRCRHTPQSATSGNGRLASHGRRRPLRWRPTTAASTRAWASSTSRSGALPMPPPSMSMCSRLIRWRHPPATTTR